ncbi:Sel1 repeat family protein [Gammaproteobacteria bacterium]
MRISSDELFDLANKAWDANELGKAFDLFIQAKNQGCYFALNSIGYFYDHGICVKKDQNAALTWYRRAARHNDSCAFSNIAIIYRDRGNFNRAKYWFLKAIHNGDADAAFELAKLYLAKNKNKSSMMAKHYLRIASESSHIDSFDQQEALRLLSSLDDIDQNNHSPR